MPEELNLSQFSTVFGLRTVEKVTNLVRAFYRVYGSCTWSVFYSDAWTICCLLFFLPQKHSDMEARTRSLLPFIFKQHAPLGSACYQAIPTGIALLTRGPQINDGNTHVTITWACLLGDSRSQRVRAFSYILIKYLIVLTSLRAFIIVSTSSRAPSSPWHPPPLFQSPPSLNQ